jgi:anti-anti-sigma factor
MSIVADTYGSMTVLAASPVLTKNEVDEFGRIGSEQVRAGVRWFILDLAKLTYLDSRGLEGLLDFQEEVEERGGCVKVAGLKGPCRQIFEMVRFDKKFETFETVHDALRSFE